MIEDVKVVRIHKRKLRFSSNSSKIDLSSLTNSVPWEMKGLEAVDSRQYPWFYRGWPPKESIGRTHPSRAGASNSISEEMIKSLIFECFKLMMFLCYFSITTSSVFCFLFFFFQSPKLWCVLYMGAHYSRVNTVIKFNSMSVLHVLIEHANDVSKLTARWIYVITQ